MFMFEFRKISWWYWLITALLLSYGVAGQRTGFTLAIGLTVVQLSHVAWRERSVTAFPLQVRCCYLLLLCVALTEPLQWLFWLPTIGTWAQIIFGYCLMARAVSLFPWNRSERFSVNLLSKTLLARPIKGSLVQTVTEASRP